MTRPKKLLCVIMAMLFLAGSALGAGAPRYTKEADILNALGLFRGTQAGYELERECTRAESAVMVVRLIGKETQALAEKNPHPFTDVEGWASPYVGWLYKHGLATGVSATRFGAATKANAMQYCAFLLRTLGYTSGKAGDFDFDNTLDFAVISGLISRDQKLELQSKTFLRDDMALLSFQALATKLKDQSMTLAEKLAQDYVFEYGKYLRVLDVLGDTVFSLDDDGHIRAVDNNSTTFESALIYNGFYEATDYIIARADADARLYLINKQQPGEIPFLNELSLEPVAASGNNVFFIRYAQDDSKAFFLMYNGVELTELLSAASFTERPVVGDSSITLLARIGPGISVCVADKTSGYVQEIIAVTAAEARLAELGDGRLLLIADSSTALITGGRLVSAYDNPPGAVKTLGINGQAPFGESTLIYGEFGLFSINGDGSVFNRLFPRPVLNAFIKSDNIYIVAGSERGFDEIGMISGDGYTQLLTGVPEHGISIAAIEGVNDDGIYFSNRRMGEKDAYHYLLREGQINVIAYSAVNAGYAAAREQTTEETVRMVEQERERLRAIE